MSNKVSAVLLIMLLAVNPPWAMIFCTVCLEHSLPSYGQAVYIFKQCTIVVLLYRLPLLKQNLIFFVQEPRDEYIALKISRATVRILYTLWVCLDVHSQNVVTS